MFKIAKFNKVNNEKVSINFVEQKHYKRSKEKPEQFKTLAFDIEAKDKENNYFFTFALNCRPEELLKIPHNETIDFSNYIFDGETFFNINNIIFEPEINIKITRYLNNNFIIYITLYTDSFQEEDDYSVVMEITFNLDDYL